MSRAGSPGPRTTRSTAPQAPGSSRSSGGRATALSSEPSAASSRSVVRRSSTAASPSLRNCRRRIRCCGSSGSSIQFGSASNETCAPRASTGADHRPPAGSPVVPYSHRASDLQPLVLEVELALDAVHDVVGDGPGVAQLPDGLALRVQHLADQALVGLRAVLEPVVGNPAGARLQPPGAVPVQAAHPLDRVLAGPLLHGQLLDA